MDYMQEFDLIVIGSGFSLDVVANAAAAQPGLQVAIIIEKGRMGGMHTQKYCDGRSD